MEINSGVWFLSALPIILLLVLMLIMKWSGLRACAFVWLTTVGIAWFFFGADLKLLGYSYVKAFFVSVDVLLVILSAILFYRVTEKSGATKKIGTTISQSTNNTGLKAILLGWLFPSFLQGVGGLGVPVAVSAPLLVSVGFSPEQSVIMASIGHAWGVTFGTMGNAFLSLLSSTNLNGEFLTSATAILLGAVAIFCGILVVFIAAGFQGIKNNIRYIAIFGFILGAGQYLLAINNLWMIAVPIPSLLALGLAFYLNILKSPKQRKNPSIDKTSSISGENHHPSLAISLLPYGILLVIILLINLIPSLNNLLNQTKIFFEFPAITSSMGDVTPAGPGRVIKILSHPGTVILAATLTTYLLFRRFGYLKKGDLLIAANLVFQGSLHASLVLFMMVEIAVIMSHTQMSSVLARGLSQIFGKDLFPFISPFIGTLGAFITGTNTNSNFIFANVQMKIANNLGLSIAPILAAQTAGGAIGSIISPAKVFLGCSTVKIGGRERQVMSKLLMYVLMIVCLMGLITLAYYL